MVMKMNEIERMLKEAKKVSKNLKITTQEALLLIIAHETHCVHDHVDRVIFGIMGAHTPQKQTEKKEN